MNIIELVRAVKDREGVAKVRKNDGDIWLKFTTNDPFFLTVSDVLSDTWEIKPELVTISIDDLRSYIRSALVGLQGTDVPSLDSVTESIITRVRGSV